MFWLIQILPHSCFMPDETMYCWWYLFSWFLERSYVVACIGQKLGFPQERDRRQKKAGCGGKFPIFNEPGSTPETLRLAYFFYFWQKFCISLGLWQNSGCANWSQSKLNAVVILIYTAVPESYPIPRKILPLSVEVAQGSLSCQTEKCALGAIFLFPPLAKYMSEK